MKLVVLLEGKLETVLHKLACASSIPVLKTNSGKTLLCNERDSGLPLVEQVVVRTLRIDTSQKMRFSFAS